MLRGCHTIHPSVQPNSSAVLLRRRDGAPLSARTGHPVGRRCPPGQWQLFGAHPAHRPRGGRHRADTVLDDALVRAGLALAGDDTDPIREPHFLAEAVDRLVGAFQLDDAERAKVAELATMQRFGPGEVVQRAGEVPDSVSLIVSGSARLVLDVDGSPLEVLAAGDGEFLGGTAVTREADVLSAIASDILTVMRIPVAIVDDIVQSRPIVAASVGGTIERRRKLAQETRSRIRVEASGTAR